MQTIAENTARICKFVLIEKKCILVILLLQETVWVRYAQCEGDLYCLPLDDFLPVYSSESFMVFFLSFRTEGASSCIGPTRSYRSCNIQVQCLFVVCFFVCWFWFCSPVAPFPQTNCSCSKVIVRFCFSGITEGWCSSTVPHQKNIGPRREFMLLILYGSQERQVLIVHLIVLLFIMALCKCFLLQTELPRRLQGFPGRAVCRVWWDRISRKEIHMASVLWR